MPAATLSRRSRYSSGEIDGTVWVFALAARALRLVGGKLAHRLRDLLGAGHEELFLRRVEGHRGDVWRGDPHHRPVEVLKSVLGDDRRDLRPEPAGEVVLVHDHRLSRP